MISQSKMVDFAVNHLDGVLIRGYYVGNLTCHCEKPQATKQSQP